MEKQVINKLTKNFEDYVHVENNIEFWFARDLQNLLGYAEWRKFIKVIEKAKTACANSGADNKDHFVKVAKMVSLGSDAKREILDFKLTRYACYLIAQNGDPRKEEINIIREKFYNKCA